MRILHIISSADPRGGGPIEGIIQQSKIRSLRHNVTTHIATLDHPDDPWVEGSEFELFALGERRKFSKFWTKLLPWRRYRYSSRMLPWLKTHSQQYDIIIINGIWNYSALASRRALVGSKIPYVVFTHGMLDPWFKRRYPIKNMVKQASWFLSEGPLLNNANAVLFTTEEERALAKNAFWPYRVQERVVGYGTGDIDGDRDEQISAFRSQMTQLGERPFLLFLSRIHEKKGCDILVEAFGSIAQVNPELDLVIAGPDQNGWRGHLESIAQGFGVTHRIHWPGMLSGNQKWGAFRAAEAFVLPSHQENFGIVVAEAMAASKPVLITNKVNIWREVVEAEAGFVEDDNIDGIRRLLVRFLDLSAEERVKMGMAARAAFLARFEISKTSKIILEALEEFLR